MEAEAWLGAERKSSELLWQVEETPQELSDVQCIEASEPCDFLMRPSSEILLSKAPEGHRVTFKDE